MDVSDWHYLHRTLLLHYKKTTKNTQKHTIYSLSYLMREWVICCLRQMAFELCCIKTWTRDIFLWNDVDACFLRSLILESLFDLQILIATLVSSNSSYSSESIEIAYHKLTDPINIQYTYIAGKYTIYLYGI